MSTDEGVVSSFLWMSDIHYDPYRGQANAANRHGSNSCSISSSAQFGCDSPLSLVSSAIASASSHDADFVVITGDFCRHQMEMLEQPRTKELPEILHTVMSMMREAQHFGNHTPILPVIGNDDAIPDYFVDITDMTTSVLQVMSDVFVENEILSVNEALSFSRGGYYARDLGELTILCLNTIIYSAYHQPDVPSFNTDPLDQFTWLEKELERCHLENRVVYIVGHIPPGIGSFGHVDMWHDQYRKIYGSIVRRYQEQVKAQLFGHFHTNEFRLTKELPLLMLGASITPIYQNNPTYRVLHYNKASGVLQDMDTYALNVSDVLVDTTNWTLLYSFLEEYNLSNMDSASFGTLFNELSSKNSGLLEKFVFNYKGGAWLPKTSQCLENSAECSHNWVCTMTSDTRQQFLNCSNHTQRNVWVGLVVGAVVTGLCCGAMRWRTLRRRYQYGTPTENTGEKPEDRNLDVMDREII